MASAEVLELIPLEDVVHVFDAMPLIEDVPPQDLTQIYFQFKIREPWVQDLIHRAQSRGEGLVILTDKEDPLIQKVYQKVQER